MSVALSIAFTGLCALVVGDKDGQPAQVLLVDPAGFGEVGGVTLPGHAPTLALSLNDLANPDSSAPDRVIAVARQRKLAGTGGRGGDASDLARADQLGLWDLTGWEVWIRSQGRDVSGLRVFRAARDETSWPAAPRDLHDPAAWRDLRFVADMKTISGVGRIDPSLTDDSTGSGLPPAVAARVHLDAGLLEGAMPSQETYREEVFEFKGAESQPTVRQALTDTIQWTLQTDAAALVIEIVSRRDGTAKRLLLAPSATPHRVFISNLPAANSAHPDHQVSDAAAGAEHFGVYYRLLRDRPAVQPLPTLSEAAPARKGAGLLRPAFCPPALFTPR